MNKSFQSYTPRVRALNYDALGLDTGCEPASGSKIFTLEPIVEICVLPHDAESVIYNQPEKVSYFLGPDDPISNLKPHETKWAAWVADAGIRYGQFDSITLPDNAGGEPAPFYSDTKPSHLSGAFNRDGFLALAIQKDADTIEITRIINAFGYTDTFSFLGVSPQLFNDGLLYASDVENRSQVACIYLRTDRPNQLFARFENEDWATEHVLVRVMQADMAALLSIVREAGHFVVHGLDVHGRDVKMTSDDYLVELFEDKATAGLSIQSLTLTLLGVPKTAGSDKTTSAISIDSLNNFLAAVPTDTISDKATLGVAIQSLSLT